MLCSHTNQTSALIDLTWSVFIWRCCLQQNRELIYRDSLNFHVDPYTFLTYFESRNIVMVTRDQLSTSGKILTTIRVHVFLLESLNLKHPFLFVSLYSWNMIDLFKTYHTFCWVTPLVCIPDISFLLLQSSNYKLFKRAYSNNKVQYIFITFDKSYTAIYNSDSSEIYNGRWARSWHKRTFNWYIFLLKVPKYIFFQ